MIGRNYRYLFIIVINSEVSKIRKNRGLIQMQYTYYVVLGKSNAFDVTLPSYKHI